LFVLPVLYSRRCALIGLNDPSLLNTQLLLDQLRRHAKPSRLPAPRLPARHTHRSSTPTPK